jgi:thioester reductase-like protein
MDHRLAIVVTSRGALIDALDAAAQGRTPAGAVRGTTLLARGKLAFLFSDLGAQTSGMGRGLHAVWPAFREAFDRCLGMFDGSEQSAISDRTATTQSALFVLEYALHALWRSWGVAPDVLAGRGLGEITAACVAGVFSLADAVRLVAARERWLMEPTQDPFRRVAESIRYQRPSTPLLCSLSGEVGGDEMCSADYWLRQVRETGCPDGVKSLHEAGVTTFVEVGPTASLGDGRDESVQVLEALGGVWSRGRSIDGSGVFPGGGRRPSLPTYPWQRRRYWLEHPGLPAPGLDGEQPAAGWLRDELARLTASERRRRMLAEVRTQVGAVLGLRGAEDLGHDRPFQELGMDSLMGLQLRNRLARAIGEQLPRDIIYSAASVERLGTALLALLGHGDDARPAASAAAPAVQSAQKSDKSRLRAALAGAPDVQTRIALLTPPLEQQLLRALGRGSLDPDLPLSETGIDDVLAAELCLRMGREQGLRVFPRELLRCGTFREFVRFVADCSGPYHAPERRLGLDELDRQIRSPYDVEALVGKETPSDQPALFVLSPPRSGSTLLRVMLAGHSRLFSPQELYLGGFSDMAAFDRHLGGTVLNMGVVATIAEVLSRNGSWNLYRQWAQSAVPTAQVYSFFGSRIGDRTLVDKSPLFFPPQAVIRRLARLFPRARFVHLVRHPVACIGSYVRERFHGIFEETQSIDPYDCAEWVWTRVQEGILELEAELGPGRMQRLYFEDLTTDPEQAFRRLCPSLGLAYEPALLTPYSGHRMVAGGFQLGDPNFVHHNKIHAEKADAWREEKLPHALRPRTLALAERLGYDTSALSSERPLRADEALHVETAMGGIDLEGDARLPLSVVPQVEAPAWHGAPRSIFLTGATGFLGAFVLDALLRHTDATVHCLARAEDVARAGQRLRENLAHYGLWRDEVQARIQPVPGDLSAPLLGMSATRYASLNREVDVVLHGAAQISYLQPYRNLFASNVEGTRRLLEFACAGRVVPVHYVSSFGSTLIRPFENTRMVDEVTAASGLGTESILELPLGYLETKWVTHRMVDEARRRGLPVTVYGPGLISGHSQSGVDSLSDSQFLHALIKGSAQLGCFPDGLGWRFIPVDVVARKVVQCTLHPASTNCDIYLDSTNLLPPELMVSALRSFGFDTRVVPYAAWRQKVLALADTNDVQNALFGFTDIIYALTPLRFLGQRYQMQWYLENRGCPEEIRSLIGPREYIQASLVRSMIDYYVRVGAMPRATMEPESP